MEPESGKLWLEAVLKRKSFEESPAGVTDFNVESGFIKKGQNFLSSIDRLTATAILNSGKRRNVKFIVKTQHTTTHMKNLSLECGFFIREITMYRDVLPKMENLLSEIGETDEIPWGQCIDVRLYDRLVLEDLTAKGYSVLDRTKQHGLQPALLVMKQFGKFHALSKILLDRGEIPMDIFEKNVWERIGDRYNAMYDDNMRRFDKALESWGDEWQEARERLAKARPDFSQRFHTELQSEPSEFRVLSHADCHSNNILFKCEDGDTERPVSMKFIDFQLCFVNTPARDLSYYLLTSVRQEVQLEHYDLLLQTYTDSLGFYLKKCGHDGFIPDISDVKNMLVKRMILPLGESMWLIPMLLSDHEDQPDMEEVMENFKEALDSGEEYQHSWNPIMNLSERNKTIIQNTFKKAIELGVI